MRTITLVIWGDPLKDLSPNVNKRNPAYRAHLAKNWKTSAYLQALDQMNRQRYRTFGCRVRVDYRFWRARRLDADNAVAAMKPLLDGIVKTGLLVDDSDRWVSIGLVTWETQRGEPPRVEVWLTPLD